MNTIDYRLSTINCLLIANRGEISSRISRTCKKMGIRSVAVFSDADKNAPFVMDSDMAVHIGESSPALSYLDQDKIIAAAKKAGADAIHPGYGFLSENASFAKKCAEEGIIFIGPNPDAIERMGSKSKAKKIMIAHDVPVVPGYQGSDQSIATLIAEAKKVGFPLLLKAAAGGGGKGMRIVHNADELEKSIAAAKRESKSAFGDDQLIIEKYIESGRHIEFQIFGDQHGTVIHLFERECSIQRRYQKIIEESPSPVMTEALRSKMSDAAIKAAKALKYNNAGTVEFIYDDKTGDFYFLEVNTRLQVEHPVTEEITGLDLVKLQIESAQGQPLAISQENVQSTGYAIEARLYAEDPSNNFMPATGTIERFEIPEIEGLRVETAIKTGSEISIFYDPMIAKIIMWAESREEAIRKLNYALRQLICQGLTTNQSFLIELTDNEEFQKGAYDTHFVKRFQENQEAKDSSEETHFAHIVASVSAWHKRQSERLLLKGLPAGWRNNFYEPQHDLYVSGDDDLKLSYKYADSQLEYTINENSYKVEVIDVNGDDIRLSINGAVYKFQTSSSRNSTFVQNESIGSFEVISKERYPDTATEDSDQGYRTPMPAQIIKVIAKKGDEIKIGDDLVIISSMKMESTIQAKQDGIINEVFVEEGQNVVAGYELLNFEEA